MLSERIVNGSFWPGGSPRPVPPWSHRSQQQQPAAPPRGPSGGARVAPVGPPAPRTLLLMPPEVQTIPDRSLPNRPAMPGNALLTPHDVQQLILAGNICGTEAEGKDEADRRVRSLQHRLRGRPIDWHEVMDELDDLHTDDKITGNTHLQLANAVKRFREDGCAQPTPPGSDTSSDTSDAEAFARAMGWSAI